MRHEEENRWHPSDRQENDDRRRESPQYRNERHFNDFGSRWGEPDPRFNPRFNSLRQEEEDFRRNRRGPQEDWRPFERKIEEQQRRNQYGDQNQQHDYEREPEWRQRDRHFNSSNQHANDRWDHENMPRPDHERRHYDDDMHRRRRNRDFRED